MLSIYTKLTSKWYFLLKKLSNHVILFWFFWKQEEKQSDFAGSFQIQIILVWPLRIPREVSCQRAQMSINVNMAEFIISVQVIYLKANMFPAAYILLEVKTKICHKTLWVLTNQVNGQKYDNFTIWISIWIEKNDKLRICEAMKLTTFMSHWSKVTTVATQCF